jgi:hypothetical protein
MNLMEAQCQRCLGWYSVVIFGDGVGGYWWETDSDGCPGCGHVSLVETECVFREVEDVCSQDS